ncbi:MAG TPA: 50S ribosomal protein L6 [Chloroflexota bacterium]|nr:50S ribosomal protein L6 [Chloroflexota bacterium]
MSRIGKMPIPVPKGVQVEIKGNVVTVSGPKGKLSQALHPDMKIEQNGSEIQVSRPTDNRIHRSLHGLTRSLINNMVEGVTNGYTRRLEVAGVGYRVQQVGKDLVLQLGFSHPVQVIAPEGISLGVEGNNRILVSGIDKQVVGETAAQIRRVRPPEPYKGKGIKFAEEQVRRKVGKTGGKKK